MTGVLVMGAIHHDVVVDAPRLPALDETLVGTGVDYRFGGKGGNQAVAAARMGAEVTMVGRVGDDAAAGTMLHVLAEAGVNHKHVEQVAGETGMSVAIALPDGGYGAVIVSGVNARNTGQFSWPEGCKVCVLQNEIPAPANAALLSNLPDEATLVFNAAPARDGCDVVLARTDVLVVNRVEARQMTGKDTPEAAARELLARGPGLVLLTLGADGVLVADDAGSAHRPARSVEVVSSHGAGDMFVGAFAAQLSLGTATMDAVDFAQAAAALLVASPISKRSEVTSAAVAAWMERDGGA